MRASPCSASSTSVGFVSCRGPFVVADGWVVVWTRDVPIPRTVPTFAGKLDIELHSKYDPTNPTESIFDVQKRVAKDFTVRSVGRACVCGWVGFASMMGMGEGSDWIFATMCVWTPQGVGKATSIESARTRRGSGVGRACVWVGTGPKPTHR